MSGKNKTLISIVLVISLVLNLLLIINYASHYQTTNDYEDLVISYCELSNYQADLINILIIELSYYDQDYEDFELMDYIDCWE